MPGPSRQPKVTASLPSQIFLGFQTCRMLWDDMSTTVLPSWVARVPRHVGNGKHKKLSAAQWKALVTIHLPITLIPLWTTRSGIFEAMLENFLDLVRSIRLATSHKVTDKSIAAYEEVYEKYLKNMCLLFPQATITPIQHAGKHFGLFLHNFGPSCEYNCFAFERLNHFCQQVKTNRRPGELPNQDDAYLLTPE